MHSYIHTCMHACIHTYLPTYLPTYLHTYHHRPSITLILPLPFSLSVLRLSLKKLLTCGVIRSYNCLIGFCRPVCVRTRRWRVCALPPSAQSLWWQQSGDFVPVMWGLGLSDIVANCAKQDSRLCKACKRDLSRCCRCYWCRVAPGLPPCFQLSS